MKKLIECPYGEGQAELFIELKELNYRKETFNIMAHFYKCAICQEEFTTTETDTITLLQAHNQYREKHSIPLVEEIISIREKYDLSASKMSDVLALGTNGYSNYERGEMPSPAIGNLIYTADNPAVFKTMLEKVKQSFSDLKYQATINKIKYLLDVQSEDNYNQIKLNQYNEANSFTGFKKINKEKLAQLLIAFITKCNIKFNDRLKLNKLLFYTDFLSYKLSGFSITGLTYRAIQYGPVPTFYDNIYAYLENEALIFSNWNRDKNGSAKECFITDQVFNHNLFDNCEQQTIELVTEKFKDISTWDLVDLSHKEKSWIELHSLKGIINYQDYAFYLKGA